MSFLSVKVDGAANVRKMYAKAKAAAVSDDIPRRIADDTLKRMQRDAPKGQSSRRSIDLAPLLKRYDRKRRHQVLEGIRIDGQEARRKALAVEFGTSRHGPIAPFINKNRQERSIFGEWKRRWRNAIKKVSR